MKNQFSLFISVSALILVACGSNSNSSKANDSFGVPETPTPTPPVAPATPTPAPPATPTPTPTPTLSEVLTSHPWCQLVSNGSAQDRLSFAAGGQMTYQEFPYANGVRTGPAIFSYTGTWVLNGTTLTANVMGQQVDAAVSHTNPDPVTGQERLHANMNGQDSPYDPCL